MRYTWDPFDEFRRMQYRMNRMLDELPEMFEPSGLPVQQEMAQVPYVDVMDRDSEVIVTADLPGVEKGDIQINVRGNTLEINAEKKSESERKEEGYLRRERGYNRFYRAIRLPAQVDDTKAHARFNNGVLEITLPKLEKRRGSSIPIN
ncbi:Hsp20/alpha crystallin family protein [Methanocella arvoryzae]|uniref:Chaperonin Hsp20 n=1 Tax=Methanocella arvoryzae (strain DSM 22066 / NBRC 105507 / MRE50) TaxID=351160 RepID=Q0W782_METAR|nr:Hsp20/alpha crystallin family protein [Methanocella arvoryzae]CAJ35761.1 chaperonin Hsp20 [Methanocella arvoryzae MRE50]